MGGDRGRERGESGGERRRGAGGVCDVHVGIDGKAEGSRGGRARAGELCERSEAAAGSRGRMEIWADVDLCGRFGEHGVVPGDIGRGAACDRSGASNGWAGVGGVYQAGRSGLCEGDADTYEGAGGNGEWDGVTAEAVGVGRRGEWGEVDRGVTTEGAGLQDRESLWADGMHSGSADVCDQRGARDSAVGKAAGEHASVRVGRVDGACASWGGRGVVYQRCGGGARVSESGGVDGGEVRAESVRAGERDADVPDGGPCEVAGGRESGVSGTSR